MNLYIVYYQILLCKKSIWKLAYFLGLFAHDFLYYKIIIWKKILDNFDIGVWWEFWLLSYGTALIIMCKGYGLSWLKRLHEIWLSILFILVIIYSLMPKSSEQIGDNISGCQCWDYYNENKKLHRLESVIHLVSILLMLLLFFFFVLLLDHVLFWLWIWLWIGFLRRVFFCIFLLNFLFKLFFFFLFFRIVLPIIIVIILILFLLCFLFGLFISLSSLFW